jgi:hypothetical protein
VIRSICLIVAGFIAQGLISGTAQAQEQAVPQACPAAPARLPPELAGWASRSPINAASTPGKIASATVTPGKGVDATLTQTASIQYAVRPEKPGGSVSYGGLFGFTVKEAGTYRVALGSAAWIDVLKGKKAVVSSAHGHGPDCSGIRKMVDFPLTPGRYTLQIAANGSASLPFLVTRLP